MSSLKAKIQENIKQAMRDKDKARLSTLRLITAAIKQREVDERIELADADILAILDKMAKQRRESIKLYKEGNRDDLVASENFELEVILSYLPQPLSDSEIDTLISEAIQQLNASSMQDMGKVMGTLKPQIQGRADAGVVSEKVKARLS